MWTIRGAFNACRIEAKIYDRWGGPINSYGTSDDEGYFPFGYRQDLLPIWNGTTSSGAAVSDGVYYYVLELENCVSSRSYSGFIHVFH